MKNATKHAEELKSLARKLMREHKPAEKPQLDALSALVRGAMSFDGSDSRAEEIMRAIDKEFVDLNELRVATDLEIQELLGARYPGIERRVAMVTQALNNIFEREHTLSLDRLKTVSRRDARQFLRELPEIHPFVEAYVMLFALDGHSVPVDDKMLAYLREEEIVDEDMSLDEAQRFVEHHLKAEDCHPFYMALRKVSAEESGRSKKRVKA